MSLALHEAVTPAQVAAFQKWWVTTTFEPDQDAWTAATLAELRQMRRAGEDITACAYRFRRLENEIERALWALLGRTPEEAAAVMGRSA